MNAPSDTIPTELAELEKRYAELYTVATIAGLAEEKAMEHVGVLIDYSSVLGKEEGLAKAFQWADELGTRPLSDPHAVLLEYFRANAWAGLRRLKHSVQGAASNWEQPELQKELLYFRRAIRHKGFESLEPIRKSQIHTNVGNSLSHIGRFVEALRHWETALRYTPGFGMAVGNLGRGLAQYARYLYDAGHQEVFLVRAHTLLKQALTDESTLFASEEYAEMAPHFESAAAEIENVLDVEAAGKSIQLGGLKLGRTQSERGYRNWVLHERLFLNPLNDLGPHAVAARDNLSLPDYVLPIGEPPTFTGFFNQMTQEYVSARWLLYESVRATRPHFSDRHVLLYNTLDYPSYSLAVEQAKAAFRAAYSIFDKIAFFLNDYAKLQVHSKSVYYKTLWYLNQDFKAKKVRSEFVTLANSPLRGLFWLSKDFFDPDFQESSEPDAEDLYTIRNRLEHSYLKIHEILLPGPGEDLFKDRLAYSVSRDSFFAKTHLVMRRARAALIYLSLGMHREERSRAAQKPARPLASHRLGSWSDSRKL